MAQNTSDNMPQQQRSPMLNPDESAHPEQTQRSNMQQPRVMERPVSVNYSNGGSAHELQTLFPETPQQGPKPCGCRARLNQNEELRRIQPTPEVQQLVMDSCSNSAVLALVTLSSVSCAVIVIGYPYVQLSGEHAVSAFALLSHGAVFMAMCAAVLVFAKHPALKKSRAKDAYKMYTGFVMFGALSIAGFVHSVYMTVTGSSSPSEIILEGCFVSSAICFFSVVLTCTFLKTGIAGGSRIENCTLFALGGAFTCGASLFSVLWLMFMPAIALSLGRSFTVIHGVVCVNAMLLMAFGTFSYAAAITVASSAYGTFKYAAAIALVGSLKRGATPPTPREAVFYY